MLHCLLELILVLHLAVVVSSMASLPPLLPPTHLIIVGAGIQGASVAYFMSQLSPTTKLTILEANPHVAPHASSKGGGFLARSWGDGTVTQSLHHTSFDLHAKLAKEWGLKSYRMMPVLSVQPGSQNFKSSSSSSLPNWLDGEGGTVSNMGDGTDTAQVHPKEYSAEAFRRSKAEVRTSATGESVKCLLAPVILLMYDKHHLLCNSL